MTEQSTQHNVEPFSGSASELKSRLTDRASEAAYIGMVLLELSPANYAAGVAVQGAFGDPVLSVAAFTGATLISEVAGAIGSVPVLKSDLAHRPIAWSRRKLDKLGGDTIKTGALTDLLIGLAAGTVALNVAKEIQDPNRQQKPSIVYGVRMALGITAVSGIGSWFAAEGLYHPTTENELLAGGVLSAVFGLKVLTKRLLGKIKPSTD
jgi:hypothetical protein